jgi:hypothetical protein
MKRIKKDISLAFVILLSLLTANAATAAPLAVISKFRFLPNGEVYHFYSFGDEYYYLIKYDGKLVNSGGIIWNILPEGVDENGLARQMVTIKGSDYYINQRYKTDDKNNYDGYPEDNELAPFFLKLEGQIGESVVDEEAKTVTVKCPKGEKLSLRNKVLNPDNKYFYYTSYGSAVYRTYHGTEIGLELINEHNGCLISNNVSDFDEIYESPALNSALRIGDKGATVFDEMINGILAEDIDFSKDTYMYLYVGGIVGHYTKFKINVEETTETETLQKAYAVPAEMVFDKNPLYAANMIINLINTDAEPQKIFVDGVAIVRDKDFAVNVGY